MSRYRLISACLLIIGALHVFAQNRPDSETGETPVYVQLVATGDVMLTGSGERVFQTKGPDAAFDSTRSVLADADIVCVNLEAPFTDRGAPFDKQFTFRMNPAYAKALKNAGVDICTLANNHVMDYGEQGLFDTFTVLSDLEIAHCGAGHHSEEAASASILVRRGLRVGFLAFSLTYPDDFWANQRRPGTAYPEESKLRERIQELQSTTDCVVVSFHWGQELMTTPKAYQQRLARQAIDWGADLIIGHHPHVIQGLEIYNGKLIAYSLGNYVFGSYSNKVQDGLLLKAILTKGGVVSAEAIPIVINNYQVHFQPTVLSGDQKRSSIEKINNLSRSLNQNCEILDFNGKIRFH